MSGTPAPCPAGPARSLHGLEELGEFPQGQKTRGKCVPDVMRDFMGHKKTSEKYIKLYTVLLPSSMV